MMPDPSPLPENGWTITGGDPWGILGLTPYRSAREADNRMRRAEAGHHRHIAGVYLGRYAQEAAWREDHRRSSNGLQAHSVVTLAMAAKPSVDFCGYWQRARVVA